MFPIVAGGSIFHWVQAPGESFDEVNMFGQPFYSRLIPDDKRNAYSVAIGKHENPTIEDAAKNSSTTESAES